MWDKERIRRLRDALGWSQEQLAKEVGYAGRATACMWENGDRKPTPPARLILEKLEARARRKGLLA